MALGGVPSGRAIEQSAEELLRIYGFDPATDLRPPNRASLLGSNPASVTLGSERFVRESSTATAS